MNFLKTTITVLLFFLTTLSVFSYDLTQKDYTIIDKLEIKLFDIIETRENVSAERVVKLIDTFIQKKAKSERLVEILEMISDDISYEYYLGEYAGDYDEEDDDWEEYEDVEFDDGEDYVDNNFSGEEDDGVKETRAEYRILDKNVEFISGEKDTRDIVVLEMVANLIHVKYIKDFNVFRVYNNPNGDTFAHVEQSKKDNTKWNMVLNISSFYKEGKIDKKESIHTLTHEFSHVLTLGKTQMRYIDGDSDALFERVRNSCKTNFIAEGCLNKRGYLNQFIDIFWKKDFQKSQDEEEEDFYTGNEDNFVTDYAATNPGEDIAESFTFFVLKSKPMGNKISDKKILFFYNFPELVKLRNFMRINIEK